MLWMVLGAGSAMADAEGDCRRSDPAVSVKACTEIIESRNYGDAEKAEALRRRGNARAAAGAFDDAIHDFDDAIALRSSDAATYAARGQARLSRDDVQGAIADLDRAVHFDPRSTDDLIARGYARLVGGLADDAIEDFNAALAIDAKSATALNNRGLAYRKKGDLNRAITDYTAAIDTSPLYALAFVNRGYAFEAKGEKAEALADFRQAILIDPTLSGAKEGLKRLDGSGDLMADSEAMAKKGKALAQRNCSWCHAIGPDGQSPNAKAPEFRNMQRRHPLLALRTPLSRSIAALHEQMPRFKLSDREVDAIVTYINSLGTAK